MPQLSRLFNAFLTPVILVECFIISNLGFLAVDIYVAHSINGFAHWAEWIPFTFSLIAPVTLIVCMIGAGQLKPPLPQPGTTRPRANQASRAIGMLVGLGSIAIGIAGLIWHL